MGISTKVISHLNGLLEIENIWNHELANHSEFAIFYSRLFNEFMQIWESKRWIPLVVTFWSNNKIVGMAPLKMLKKLYTRYICNLESMIYSNFIFFNDYREVCMNQLLDLLFSHLNCRTADITLDNNSPNLRLLEKVCKNKGLHIQKTHYFGRAIILIKTSWYQFYNSLNNKVRKEFRRIERKLDRLGSWRVYCCEVDSDSIKKIFTVEQMSWKNEWRKQKKIPGDYSLCNILRSFQQNCEANPIIKSEIWFLEVNGQTIAYQVVLVFKGIAVLVKTSYDNRFKMVSPGKFLINTIIREFFSKRNVKKIDFISNLPFVQIWNPLCEKRTKVIIDRNHYLSKTVRFTGRIPLFRNYVNLVKKII